MNILKYFKTMMLVIAYNYVTTILNNKQTFEHFMSIESTKTLRIILHL